MARRKIPEPPPPPVEYALKDDHDEDRDLYLIELPTDDAKFLRSATGPVDFGSVRMVRLNQWSLNIKRKGQSHDITLGDARNPIELAEIRKLDTGKGELRWIGSTPRSKIVVKEIVHKPMLRAKKQIAIVEDETPSEDNGNVVVNIEEVIGKRAHVQDNHVKTSDDVVRNRFYHFIEGKESATEDELYHGIKCTREELQRLLSGHAERIPGTRSYRWKFG